MPTPFPSPDGRLCGTALLRHTPPDDAPHFDWLVVLDGRVPAEEDRSVPCMRLRRRLDLAESGMDLHAESLPPHRGLYLALAAPRSLSGGRGLVEPIRRGEVLAVRPGQDGCTIDLRWRETRDGEGVLPETDMRVRLDGRPSDRISEIRIRVERVRSDAQGSDMPGSELGGSRR